MSVQYRLVVAKKDERTEGPDDAEVVLTAPIAAVGADGFDPTVAYMRGVLKASGHTGRLLEVLKSGDAAAAFGRLVTQQ